jgi:hypothetical protein
MSNRSFLAVLFSVLAGAIIWAVHFTIIYGFTSTACARGLGTDVVPWAVAGATGVAALAATAVIVRSLRPVRAGTPEGDQAAADFIRWVTAAVAGMALVAVILEGFAVALVPPACSAGRQKEPGCGRLRSSAPIQAAIRATLPTR